VQGAGLHDRPPRGLPELAGERLVTCRTGDPVTRLEHESTRGCHDELRIALPRVLGEHVDEQLDLVAVGVEHVERVRHRVVARAHDGDPVGLEFLDRGTQLVVSGADLEAEVVQADAGPERQWCGGLADLDEQQFVVGPAGGERRADRRRSAPTR